MLDLQIAIEQLYARQTDEFGDEYFRAFDEFKSALNEGRVRAAEPDPASPTGWKVNTWVKKGILLGFRIGCVVEMHLEVGGRSALPLSGITDETRREPGGLSYQFRDKHTFPLKQLPRDQNVRIVPGGSSIRDGCYIGKNVTCMPPMYVNVGAYVDDGTMIDSHALVGSCAQVGKRVHISAGAQIGGVLEPIGAMPVIVEDEVLVGGNCGVYEGTIVGKGTVLAAGTILTGSTPVYDLGAGRRLSPRGRKAVNDSFGCRGCPRRPRHHHGTRKRAGPFPLHSCHHQVSRREDRPSGAAGRTVAVSAVRGPCSVAKQHRGSTC